MDVKKLYEIIHKNDCIEFGVFQINNIFKQEVKFNILKLYNNKENIKLICNCIYQKLTNPNSILESYDDIKHIVNLNNRTIPLMIELSEKLNKNLLNLDLTDSLNSDSKFIGNYDVGDSCILICDVCISGFDIFKCVEDIQNKGILVEQVIYLVNYDIGGDLYLEKNNINSNFVISFSKLTEHLFNQKNISSFNYNKIINCIESSSKVLKQINTNENKPKEEQNINLIQMTKLEIQNLKTKELIEKEEEIKKKNEIYNQNIEDFKREKIKIEQRENELLQHEKDLMEKCNKINQLQNDFNTNYSLKTQKLDDKKRSLIIQTTVSNIMGFIVGGFSSYILFILYQ